MIVVTGAAGFIGSAFVSELNSKGLKDLILVDEALTAEKEKNLAGKSFTKLYDKDEFLAAVKNSSLPKISAIIHMGACSSTVERREDYIMDTNFRYTQTLIEYTLKHNARMIYASSAATYGDGAQGYDDSPNLIPSLKPLNLYGQSKQLLDEWVLKNGYERSVVGLKFFNVYGPNEYHKGFMASVAYKSYRQVKAEGKIQLFRSYRNEFKDGEQKRDFIYVKDCSAVMWWLLNNSEVNGIFNLGTGKARSWNDLAKAVFAALGLKPSIQYIEMPEEIRSQYQYFTEAKMLRLFEAGCPVKLTSLEDGVADYCRSYLEHSEKVL